MRIVKSVVSVLLCVIIFASLVFGITAQLMRRVMNDYSILSVRIADNEYYNRMYNSLYWSLENKMALVSISAYDMSDIISKDMIRNEAPKALKAVLATAFGETKTVQWKYESEELLAHIKNLLTAYASENGIEYEEGSAEKVYDIVCETVTNELKIVADLYTEKLTGYTERLRHILDFWYIPIMIYAAAVICVLVMGKRNMRYAVYTAVLPSYFASFTVFAMSAVLYSKDYLSVTVLSDGMLQYLIRQIYNIVLHDLRNTSFMLTLIFIAAVLILIAALSVQKEKRHHHRRHHHHHTSHSHGTHHESHEHSYTDTNNMNKPQTDDIPPDLKSEL